MIRLKRETDLLPGDMFSWYRSCDIDDSFLHKPCLVACISLIDQKMMFIINSELHSVLIESRVYVKLFGSVTNVIFRG